MPSIQFPRLFQPGRIGNLEIKNRIVMPAISTKYSTAEGEVTQRYIRFCAARAAGGAGLIIIENTCVDWPRGKGGVNPVRIDRERFVPSLNELVEAVHLGGAKIATQLQHVGRQTNFRITEGAQPIAPSAVSGFGHLDVPKQMDSNDIAEVIELFGEAARRTKLAGFDAVEIHGAHGYLITQFLSPFLNRRTDEFGGSLENRLRFPLAVVRRIRESVGPDFPVIFRYSVEEGVEGGLHLEEAKIIAVALEEAGIDALHVSSGIYESSYRIFPVMAMPMGCYRSYGETIKKQVNIPVIVVGKINDPALAEQIIAEGKADYVAIGRQLLADPEFPNKAREGRTEDIRPCLSCNNGCIGRFPRQWRLKCDVNPALGNETIIPETRRAQQNKRIIVIGGGPAGMQCALDCAAQGHDVNLFEKDGQLGGLLNVACRPPGKEQIRLFRDFLVRQVSRAKIKVHWQSLLELDSLKRMGPDAVILAVGATPDLTKIDHDGEGIFSVEDALTGTGIFGERIAVIGAGQAGSETAEYMAKQGRSVKLLELRDDIASDLESASRMHLKMRLKDVGVEVLTKTQAVAIKSREIAAVGENGPLKIVADSVVLALGYVSRQTLLGALSKENFRTFAIGDCVKPRKIFDAIHEASYVAGQLSA